MPPPVPWPLPVSLQTSSDVIASPDVVISVPPQPIAQGLDAGYCTWSAPSLAPLVARLSPAATNTEIRSVAASWNAASIAWRVAADQAVSFTPQLIEITVTSWVVSWMAVVTASTKPVKLAGAK